MQPAGPLMVEHRVIERLISLMGKHADTVEKTGKPDLRFIGAALDFIRTYADRCHHGKEEDILFCALREKPLTPELSRILQELLDEHARARELVRSLTEAERRYADGETGAVGDIIKNMRKIAELYPAHIFKEDKVFFLPSMNYFSPKEQAAILRTFERFDRKLIHEKYRKVVEGLED